MKKSILSLLAISLLYLPLTATAENTTSVTIYSRAIPGAVPPELYRPVPGGNGWSANIPGYAVVRQKREMSLPQKQTELKFSDVASLIDPSTVSFTSVTAPKETRVLEQNYLYDLVSRQALLQRYIGQDITVEQTSGNSVQNYKGTLMSVDDGLILQTDGGKVIALNAYDNIRFPELPGGLMTKPTLVWQVETSKPGKQDIEISYETQGISWWADYNLIFTPGKDANSGLVDLNAWVSIINQSGATYPNAALKLVAGEVGRAQSPVVPMMARDMRMKESMVASAPQFSEKAFAEFHLYTLQRKMTLPDRSTKQIELFPAVARVPVVKQYVFEAAKHPTNAAVTLEFQNAEAQGLGIPLPQGRVRVNQRDSDGSLEFVGEDTIRHTPRNEKVDITLGSAFDVVGERVLKNSSRDEARRTSRETYEITIKNRKKEPIALTVREMLNGLESKIETKAEFTKKDAQTLEFPLKLKADAEEKITYTVEYRW